MTDTNRASLLLAPQTAWGTVATSSIESKAIRMTGESLTYNISNTQSDEIRSDRNVADLIRTDASVGGDINFEMSYGGTYTVSSVSYNHAMDDLLEGVMCSSFSSNVLKNGTATKAYTLEKQFGGATSGGFHRLRDVMFDGMTLNLSAGSIVTGSVSALGSTLDVSDSTLLKAPNANSVSSTDVMNAIDDVTLIQAQDSATATDTTLNNLAKCMNLSITVANNLRVNNEIGTLGAARIGLGQFVVTGTMSLYFENKNLYQRYIGGNSSGLKFKIEDNANTNGNSYTFEIPLIEFTSASVLAGSSNADVMVELGFQGKYYASDGATMKITRADASA